jgi:cytochrome c-type biogenesis protein CcmH/NrfF
MDPTNMTNPAAWIAPGALLVIVVLVLILRTRR